MVGQSLEGGQTALVVSPWRVALDRKEPDDFQTVANRDKKNRSRRAPGIAKRHVLWSQIGRIIAQDQLAAFAQSASGQGCRGQVVLFRRALAAAPINYVHTEDMGNDVRRGGIKVQDAGVPTQESVGHPDDNLGGFAGGFGGAEFLAQERETVALLFGARAVADVAKDAEDHFAEFAQLNEGTGDVHVQFYRVP